MKSLTAIFAAAIAVAVLGVSVSADAASRYRNDPYGHLRHYGNPYGFYGGESSSRYAPFYYRQYHYKQFFGPYYYRPDDPRFYNKASHRGPGKRRGGYADSACAKWEQQCAQNWGSRGANYRGCLRYHRCQ